MGCRRKERKELDTMKTKILLAAGLILTASLVGATRAQAFGWFETHPLFYAELAPHGSWFSFGVHGWVWRPSVALTIADWRPYCHGGYWTMDEGAWCWRSNYPWGHIPFHYGRWLLTDDFGWVWIPGAEWSPAWVSWRCDGNYWGWAPRPPEFPPYRGHHGWGSRHHTSDTTLSIGFDFGLTDLHFVFMDRNRFHGRPVETEGVPRCDTRRVYQRTEPYHRPPEPPPAVQPPPPAPEPAPAPSRRTIRVQRVVSAPAPAPAPTIAPRPAPTAPPPTLSSVSNRTYAPTPSSSAWSGPARPAPAPAAAPTGAPTRTASSANHGSRSSRVQAVLRQR
jgi:hypothetical protein